jgi:hypothetical protein
MKKRTALQKQRTFDDPFSPSLNAAIAAWNLARQRFQNESSKENLNAYETARNVLGQAISHWQIANPALVGEFRLWTDSHPECWSVSC